MDYLFTVLGSDHPSIIEAYTRRKEEGKVWPRLLIFLHEVSCKLFFFFSSSVARPSFR